MNANVGKSRVGVTVTTLAAALLWTTAAAGGSLVWYVSQWNGVPGTDCGAARQTPAGAFQTIEAAVDCANQDSGDTIKIEAVDDTHFEYFLAHSLIISAKMNIVGTGPGFVPATVTTAIPAIDAGGKFRVLENVSPNTTITDLEIDNGLAADKGGGIWNHPKGAGVTLTRVVIDANSAPLGGGIYNQGTVIADHTTISDNEATGANIDACTRAAGITGRGGGIYNDGTAGGPGGNLTLTFVTIEANTATSTGCADGGGLFNDGGLVTIQDSLVQSNRAIAQGAGVGGGGIANFSGPMSVERTHVSDNTVKCPLFIPTTIPCGVGGGIINLDSLTLKDNTFLFGNGPDPNSGPIRGGGLYTSNGSTVTIKYTVTFSSNTTGTFAGTGEGGGIYNYGDGPPVGQVNFASNSTTNFNSNSSGQCGGTGTYKPSGQAKLFNNGLSMSNCPF